MRLLITGATGFLGSYLARRALADRHQVRVLYRRSSSLERLCDLPVEEFVGDITLPETLPSAIEGCDWVIHAAANVNYWRGEEDWQMKVNVEGTRNIARAAREAGVKRFLHVSSVAAIGLPTDRRPATEQCTFNLEHSGLAYHVSKHRAELEVLREASLGLDAVIVNPASIQGRSRTIGLINSVKRSPVVPCFSGGNCIVDVEDVVNGIMAALVRGESGERYILGGENLTFRELGQKAASALHLRRSFVSIPPMATGLAAAVLEPWARMRGTTPKMTRMIHYCANRFQYFDSTKAREAFRYTPRSVDTIIAETLGTMESPLVNHVARN